MKCPQCTTEMVLEFGHVVRLGESCSTARSIRNGWNGGEADDGPPRQLPPKLLAASDDHRKLPQTLDTAGDLDSRHLPATATIKTVNIVDRLQPHSRLAELQCLIRSH